MSLEHLSFAIVALSVGFQFAAGVLALRLIPASGRKAAWTLIALALFGMGLRRSIVLFRLGLGGAATPLDFEYELIGLLVSVLMFAGVLGIAPIFAALANASESLKRSEARYRAFVENTLEGVVIIDPATKEIIDSNAHFRELTGYEAEELHALKINALAPGKDKAVERNIKAVLENGRQAFGEHVYRKKNGDEIFVEVSAVALEGETGPLLYVVAHDVTERKREAESRERMIAELEDAMGKVKVLSGLIPICATCKKIRNDAGYWTQLEKYLSDHADVVFTHGICPGCAEEAYAEIEAGVGGDANT